MPRRFLICFFLLFIPSVAYAGETNEDNADLKAEALDRNIGRMGEVEEFPEGFEFSEAENSLWLSNHLENIVEPSQLYYEFVKSGSYEEGFSDSVYLDIFQFNEDGTKNAKLEFLTGERKQTVTPGNVTNIIGNPILGIFMQGDVYEMNRLTEGHWRYFHKQIKVALREAAVVEAIEVDFNGAQVAAKKISFSPYLNDPHRNKFEKFAEKTYEIILSDEIPGSLYKIRTLVLDKEENATEPVMEEVLTLVSARTSGKE